MFEVPCAAAKAAMMAAYEKAVEMGSENPVAESCMGVLIASDVIEQMVDDMLEGAVSETVSEAEEILRRAE